jgi:hypothetical protein
MTEHLLSSHLRLFAIAVLLALLVWVARLVRHNHLSLRDSLVWLLSTALALFVTLFPAILGWTARLLQIELPSNALFVLTFVYVLLNLLAVTIGVSQSAVRTRRLAQECAVLRAELRLLQAKLRDGDPAEAGR